jgi:3-keto-disaccharide hydrolase
VKKSFTLGFVIIGIMVCMVLSGCLCNSQRSCNEWVTLFDGSDIDQWDIVEGGEWTIENDVLVGRNGRNWSTNPETCGSWLRSKKMYADFELQLDYAISKNSNSGVHFRSAAEKNPSFTGYEMQIFDCYGKEANKHNSGIYDVVGLSKNVLKPSGEWNHAVIRAQGHLITIILNGEKVVEHTGDRRLEGYLGLQNHDDRAVIRFKDIRIKELKKPLIFGKHQLNPTI